MGASVDGPKRVDKLLIRSIRARLPPMRWLIPVLLAAFVLQTRPAHADTKAEARRYFQRGMRLIESGRYSEGIASLQKAYSIRPHRNVLFNIGRAYARAGNVDRAVDYFERYLATNPRDKSSVQATLRELKLRQNLRALVDEGMTAINSGRYLEGIALLKRAYAQRPHANLLFNIGRAYEDAGEGRRAVEMYRRYLRTKPRDAAKVRKRIANLERTRVGERAERAALRIETHSSRRWRGVALERAV